MCITKISQLRKRVNLTCAPTSLAGVNPNSTDSRIGLTVRFLINNLAFLKFCDTIIENIAMGLIYMKNTTVKRPLRRLLAFAKPWAGTLIITSVVLLIASLMSLVTPELVRRLTGAISNGSVSPKLILIYSLILIGSYLIRGVCRFLSMWLAHVAAWEYVAKLTLTVYDKLQRLSMRYFGDKQTGQLMSRVINDTRNMEVLIAHAVPDLFANAVIIVGVGVMIFTINPTLAVFTLLPVPFVLLVSTLFSKKVMPLFRINQQVFGELGGEMQDRISGIKEIQAFAKEDCEYRNLKDFCRHYSEVNIRANFANAIYNPSVEFLTSLGTVVVMAAGGLAACGGSMTASDIVGFFMYLSLFYQPLTVLARLAEDAASSLAGGIRVLEILDEEIEIKNALNAKSASLEGEIEFENVSFGYDDDIPVLKNISFKAEKGSMTAFVGATGVGKTTIISLLERFYDPVSGRVLIDGQDIKYLDIASLRNDISIVLQDVFLFNGSIYDNIAYGKEGAVREDVIAAAKAAFADEFISAMPEGYDTLIGERGVKLSGGQKQRISIARAILRNSPILILDEATSAVDNETEEKIQKAIEGLSRDRTVIVVAHRLSTVHRADKIIMLEKGSIAESGTHDELIAKNGAYAKLYKSKTE